MTEAPGLPASVIADAEATADAADARAGLRTRPARPDEIAGVLARRIVCRVRAGDKLAAGERFGLIRFGSRTDLVVPRSTEMRVKIGDRVRGGETVMGVLR